MKFLKRATLIVACISAIYLISSYFLLATPYSLRMWVDAAGKLLTVLILPLLVILWGGAYIGKVVEERMKIFTYKNSGKIPEFLYFPIF